MVRTRLALVVALLLSGCAAHPIGSTSGHDEAEMAVSANDLERQWAVEGDWRVSPVLEVTDGASRVGVLVGLAEPGALPALEARRLEDGEPAGEWVAVEGTWSEADYHVGVAELGEVSGGAQLRIRRDAVGRLQHLRWNAVIPAEPEPEVSSEDGDGVGAAREALRSELSAAGVISREAWGARSTRCSSHDPSKDRMAVHYTVTPSQNPERQVRAIQRYHMDTRGWCDVGYHFLVGADGTVYEGRPLHLRGAHVGGHNTGNIGVAFIGCFNPYGCRDGWGPKHPPEVMIEAGGELLGALADLHDIPVDSSHLKGHRDHSGASTSCPGDYLYERLGDLRAIARSGGDTAAPAPSEPEPEPTPTEGGSCAHSYGGTYGHLACSDGWQCCDGEWKSRGACGDCGCVEETGTEGCVPEPEPEPEPTPTEGASCDHSYGGTYGHLACSAGWQCCDGEWTSRGSCGSCTCVEETGTEGCGVPEPPGESCGHSYGGTYGHLACSAGWQCCDGEWKSRGACGGCTCVEESGTEGCGS